MWRVSDSMGRLEMKEVMLGEIDRSKLDSQDVYLVGCENELFVWIGKGKTKYISI